MFYCCGRGGRDSGLWSKSFLAIVLFVYRALNVSLVWEGSEGRSLLGEGSMAAALLASERELGRSRPCSGRRVQTGAFRVIYPSSCCPPPCTVTARQASGLCWKLLPAPEMEAYLPCSSPEQPASLEALRGARGKASPAKRWLQGERFGTPYSR